MKFGVLGTGTVGATIGTKLVSLGHEVKMGAREATNDKAAAWVKSAGERASQGTFQEAAAFGEIVFNSTLGSATEDVLRAIGPDALRGKILIDQSNPLDFSKGFPPTLFTGNTDSLGELIQRTLPETKVVKALNTITAELMVNPAKVADANHDLFIAGDDEGAKGTVTRLVQESFGWKHVVDLGGIANARGTEQYLALWVRLYGALKTPYFNVHIAK